MQVYIRACIELAVEQRQLSRHYDVAFAETVVSALLAGMLGDLMRSSQRAGLETAAKKAADLLVNALQLCPANPGPA